jgi:type VI secretion system protein ImpL
MDKVMRNWWALALPAAMILTLLGELGLPLLFPALRAPWFRLSLIALVALGFGAVLLWRRWRRGSAAPTLSGTLAEPSLVEAEEAALGQAMRDALAQLKRQAGGQRNHLYQRPWYLVIGPPGAGKTTALAQAGLRFPWSDTAVKGIGGTRNLDVWFAEEAVFVDTAGRYTTQDSDADTAGWATLLRLLRQHRPLEPIHGVIVSLGIDTLIASDRPGLDEHIKAIRRRLTELGELLQISVPVYLLLTKADLLAGFTEYFDDLSAEGRRAVLGATLDPAGSNQTEAVIAAYDDMLDALWARRAKRLQDEPDQRKRGMILALPAQFVALRAPLAYLLDGAFRGERETTPFLRGVYCASGTQGGTPFDRVLQPMATPHGGMHPPPREGKGRPYFLNRLLGEVVIPEAGMVRPARHLRQRRRMGLIAGLAALGLGAVAMLGLWGHAFARNKALQSDLLADAETVSGQIHDAGLDLAEVRDSDPDLEQALPVLDRLRDLPGGYAEQARGAIPWSMRLGLFQTAHAETARQAYLEALQRILLPRLLLRAEQAMREQQQAPAALYAPLKAYLMLGGYGPLDRGALRAFVTEDWRMNALPGADRADLRARLVLHLDALLADPDLGRVWPGRRAPLDGALIASSRNALQSLSLADRAYAVLRQRAAAMGRPDWTASRILASGDRQAFRNGDAVLSAAIPWFFTREGYAMAYRPGLRDVQADLDRDLWVLGPDAAKQSIRDQIQQMRSAVAQAYARDYSAAWDAMIATPRPADYFQDAAALGAISRSPSPLKVLLLEAVRNTQLGGDGGPARDQIDAGQAIQEHFRALAAFAGSGAADAPIDTLLKAVRQAAVANAASHVPGAALSGGAVQGQFATALGELSTAGVVAPPQLSAFVAEATRSGAGAATRTARSSLDQDYRVAILPACLQASDGRYPFVATAPRDASPADLQRVFGANGQIDAFARDRLTALLDTARPVWRWRDGDPVASGFDGASATQFQRAAMMRDLLSGGLPFSVGLDGLGKDVTAVELSAGGTRYRFETASAAGQPLLWNLAVLPAAELTLFSGRRVVSHVAGRGPFALFRLMGQAVLENAGQTRIRARFGEGSQTATLRIELPGAVNPFGRSGPFAFRCPRRL